MARLSVEHNAIIAMTVALALALAQREADRQLLSVKRPKRSTMMYSQQLLLLKNKKAYKPSAISTYLRRDGRTDDRILESVTGGSHPSRYLSNSEPRSNVVFSSLLPSLKISTSNQRST